RQPRLGRRDPLHRSGEPAVAGTGPAAGFEQSRTRPDAAAVRGPPDRNLGPDPRAVERARRGSDGVITVHGFSSSGNCHKVRLLLEQLGRDYRWIEIDSSKGETRMPGFLAKNLN